MDTVYAKSETWTPERVSEAMVEAFRMLPTMPVYSPRKAEFLPVLPDQDLAPLDVLAFSEKVLGRSSTHRRILLLWARARATKGDVGGSVRHYCREAGTNVSTFSRRRKEACARIAAEMNRARDRTEARLEVLRTTIPSLADRIDRL